MTRALATLLFLLAATVAVAEDEPARTLDTVAIEGEVEVPQVLFISSRDHLRFHDGTGDHYRPGALDVILAAILPTRLTAVTSDDAETMIDLEQAEPAGELPPAEKE